MIHDVIFDTLAERFERKIYGSEKGDLRLHLLWDDLLHTVPELQGNASLTVLDAGGGLGQLSQRLAAHGHHVTLAEPAAPMLERARTLFHENPPCQNGVDASCVRFLQSSIQDLPSHLQGQQFDLVVCHAVLEWLADPLPTLEKLMYFLKSDGWLSLAFYNKESIIWKNLLKGNLKKIRAGKLSGDPGSLTPINPQSAPEVLSWLQQQGFNIASVTGIRCLNDYLYPGVSVPPEELLAVERELGRQEPYKWLGRYIHVIARKQKQPGND